MALWIVKNNGKISYGIKRYLCDTLEDLPYNENGEAVAPGSKAYVVSEKETFMMGSNGEWYQIEEGTGASSMAQLSDVDLTNLDDGQVLKYDEDNHKWVPSDDVSATSLGNLEDVDLTNLQDGQIIRYDRTTESWLASNIPSDFVELTQSEYDALELAGEIEEDVMYFITDGTGGSVALLKKTLHAGDTTLTFTNAAISVLSLIDVYADIWYSSYTQSAGSVEFVFPVQTADKEVKVKVSRYD